MPIQNQIRPGSGFLQKRTGEYVMVCYASDEQVTYLRVQSSDRTRTENMPLDDFLNTFQLRDRT